MPDSILTAFCILSLLSDCDVQDICIAPGSRNAPFALLRERFPTLRWHVHFDERDLGFLALGMALGNRKPVAVITTSGTAAGNLLPAVMESRNSHIPLILITADRPWELLETGSNQTCEQDRLYGSYARFMHVPVLSDATLTAAARRKILTALSEAAFSGIPLHLNVELREPLYGDIRRPEEDEDPFTALKGFPADGEIPGFRKRSDFPDIFPGAPFAAKLREFFSGDGKTLVAAGAIHPDDAEILADFLGCSGCPVLADIQSNLRGRQSVLPPFDILTVRSPGLTERLREFPRMAVIGGRFISKKILAFIRDFPGEVIFITAYGDGINATSRPGLTVRITPRALTQMFPEFSSGHSPDYSPVSTPAYPDQNIAAAAKEIAEEMAEEMAEKTLPENLSEEARLTEISATAILSRINTPLLVGNSLPARLADCLLFPQNSMRIFSLRGVSGIDGLIAAAAGLSRTSPDSGITAVIGDMSALYGLTGIALLKKYRVRLIIFNNNGGNIFMKFPINSPAVRNDLFVNPQNTDFSRAAAMFGIPWRRVTRIRELREILKTPVGSDHSGDKPAGEIIEIPFPQGEGLDLLQKLIAPKTETGKQ